MCGREIFPYQVIIEFTFEYYVRSLPATDPRSDYAYTFKTVQQRKDANPGEAVHLHGHEGMVGVPYVEERYSKGGVVKFCNHTCPPNDNCALYESSKGKVYLVSKEEKIMCGDELTIAYATKPKGKCWCITCAEDGVAN